MLTQHVAAQPPIKARSEALESHFRPLQRAGYIMDKDSTMFPSRISQEALTLSTDATAHPVSKHSFKSNRRHRCQRASNYWQHLALSLLLLPVRASSRSKNLSFWTQPQFRLSQYTQANTSNTLTGWAFAPTLTTPCSDGHMAGGAAKC